MSNTFLALRLNGELQLAITEREAMIAENDQRKQLGQSMAYIEKDFDYVRTQIQNVIAEARELLQMGINE